MKHSPSKKRPSQAARGRTVTLSEVEGKTQLETEAIVTHGRTYSDGAEPG